MGASRLTSLRRVLASLVAWAAATCAQAATFEVTVSDEQGRPVERVAVYARALAPAQVPPSEPTATMDQQDYRFVPHLLVVQKGTSVTFPNNDDVSHHVYSFSPTKPFELGLYKGEIYPPVVFEDAGVIVLGCNIHDGMLGYIVVVDTPYFALTGADGVARIEGLPSGDYALEVWTPRVRAAGLPAAQTINAGASGVTRASAKLTGRLAPDHEHEHPGAGLSWERY